MKIRSTGKNSPVMFPLALPAAQFGDGGESHVICEGDEATAVTVVDVTGLTDAQKDGAHWVLESAPADKGRCQHGQLTRIKHVASGKYLLVDAGQKHGAERL